MQKQWKNFNPRFPRGKRHGQGTTMIQDINFNPRFPRGKRLIVSFLLVITVDFNPRFPRGKRLKQRNQRADLLANFNPRFPRGKRPLLLVMVKMACIFQSTLPAGEATTGSVFHLSCIGISIHASRGGSDPTIPLML